ncbi:MAG: glycosyltransferase family 2 protein [Lachnospiraceae bacterium]|nr:glycosyltransferase family 2 protein [Lachnospiraceae bacterium]
MDKLFSIIIPCYNAVKYIDRAMDSVMGQTVDPSLYEVIAVDDASTDDTLNCLRKWETAYPDTVKVITYETNLRQGGARNIAIKQATGEYVCFLDADDWLEKDALQAYEFGIKSGDYDIVSAKSEENYEYSLTYEDRKEDSYPVGMEFTPEDKCKLIGSDLGYVCTAVYRRTMILENDVWFPEHLAYEDIYWQRMIKFYAKGTLVIDHVTLHHYIHSESTINKRNAPHQIDRLTSYEMYLAKCKNTGFLGSFYNEIMKDTMETYFFNSYYLFFVNMDSIPDVYRRIRDTIYGFFPDWEAVYDDSAVPMVFQYMLKLLKVATDASPEDIQPFKDAIIELIDD